MKKTLLIAVTVIGILFTACNTSKKTDNLIGKWQPLGDSSRVLEFTPEGYYNLFVGNMNIFQDIEDYGRIKYQFVEEGSVIKLNLMDETLTKEFVNGQIEITDEDHISIAFYQNEGEVNVKEQYERVK